MRHVAPAERGGTRAGADGNAELSVPLSGAERVGGRWRNQLYLAWMYHSSAQPTIIFDPRLLSRRPRLPRPME